MTRLLIADDHPIIIAGLKTLLRDTGYEIVREVQDGDTVREAIAQCEPDILVLDEQMPGKSGLDVFVEVRAAGNRQPVVLLTGNISDERALQAIEAGVDGLVLKHTAPDQLVLCLDEVRQGRRWIDQGLLQRALARALERKEKASALEGLSPRERETVELVAAGLGSAAIAERLGISQGTVKVHLHNVYQKLGLSDRSELLRLIREAGVGG